jgi:hypothetical protein
MYDVLVSTTTPDVNGLHAHPALISVSEVEEEWIDYSVDLSAYAGQTVYLGFWQYTSNGYALCIDDIKVASPVNMDASVISLDIADVHLPGASIAISGQVVNGGLTAINSFSINWAVDGGAIHSDILSGLTFSPETYYSFNHTMNWIPASNGTYSLKVWTDALNGGGDLFAQNDTLTQVVYVNSFPRTVLMEEFTNASCPPCADQNPAYDALIQANMIDAKVCALKYHVAWPGFDPMYDQYPVDAEERVAYYGVYGVPFAVTDGQIRTGTPTCYIGAPLCIDQDYIDSLQAVPAIFDIAIGSALDASNYSINAKVTAKTDIPENSFTVHVVVLEDLIDYGYSPGTNGEESFSQVVRKMLPTSDGTPLGTLLNGQSLSLYYTTPVESYYNPDALRVLVFLQNESGKKIYQSQVTASAIATGVATVSSLLTQVTILPNPVTDQLSIHMPPTSGKAIFTLFSSVGQEVIREEITGETDRIVNVIALPAGIYFAHIKCGDQLTVRKIVKEN